eukprot:scaffold2486_cov160-Amphora_coffeaeformis.AAC.2
MLAASQLSKQRNSAVRAFSTLRRSGPTIPKHATIATTGRSIRTPLDFHRRTAVGHCQFGNKRCLSAGHELNSRNTQTNDIEHLLNDEIQSLQPTDKDIQEYWMQEQGLNEAQCEAVTQPLSAITRVVAGPGSGKTRVLTCRIAHLLQMTPNERVLAVTFTRKAAGEMQQRLQTLLEQQDGPPSDEIIQEGIERPTGSAMALTRVTLGTFHSVCAKILRWNGDLLATLSSVAREMSFNQGATTLDGNFVIIDQGEQLRLLKECLNDANINLKDFKDIRPFNILSAISEAKSKFATGQNPFETDRDVKRIKPVMKITSAVFPYYVQKMLSTNCLDFDDLILMARELLYTHKDVRERLQRRWTHVLIDEFQDTSKTQMDLVKLLTSSSLFVVGDADQSIYSWRGAHVGSLMDLENDFRDYLGGVQTVYLMENYRSTSNIVKAAQKIISSSSGSKADKLRQDMKPKRGSGPAPRVVSCADDKAEAEHVIQTIKENLKSGKYDDSHQVALIYRTNAQSRVLEEACVQHNVPYVQFGSATSFYKRQEIQDTLCFLRWLHNGSDRGSMLRAFKTPAKGLGDKAIQEFDEYCSLVAEYVGQTSPGTARPTPLDILLSFSSEDQLVLGPDVPQPSDSISTRPLKLFTLFSQQMRHLREKAYEEPLETVVSFLVDDFQLLPHLDKLSKTTSEFEERKANVLELLRATQRYTASGPCMPRNTASGIQSGGDDAALETPLGNYLDDVALVTDMADQARESDDKRFKVCLMTIHASKGMEFDTVFVVGNEDGTFPTSQALMEGEGSVVLEEEKRLCYVAMTRAKTELFLTWRKEVPIFTALGIRTVEKKRSRFLDVLVSKKGKAGSIGSSESGKKTGKNSPTKKKNNFSSSNGTNAVFAKRSSPHRPDKENSSIGRRTMSTFSERGPGTSSSSRNRPDQSPSWLDQGRSRTASLSSSNQQQKSGRRVVQPNRSGTQSVYTRQQSIVANSPAERFVPRLSGNPSLRSPGKSQAAQKKDRTPPMPAQKMDSTWFFPVGSKVKHVRFGEGVVLHPPPAQKEGEMPVLDGICVHLLPSNNPPAKIQQGVIIRFPRLRRCACIEGNVVVINTVVGCAVLDDQVPLTSTYNSIALVSFPFGGPENISFGNEDLRHYAVFHRTQSCGSDTKDLITFLDM